MKEEKLRENEEGTEKSTPVEGSRKNKRAKEVLKHILWTVVISLFVLVFYRVSLSFPFFTIVMGVYMLALVGLILWYMIYNRGFTRLHIKKSELPSDWSEEEKTEYIVSGEKRLYRSRWLLYFIIGLLFTFLTDAIELFVISSILSWF